MQERKQNILRALWFEKLTKVQKHFHNVVDLVCIILGKCKSEITQSFSFLPPQWGAPDETLNYMQVSERASF